MQRFPALRLILFLLICTHSCFSQCSYAPADCPADQLPDSAERLQNPVSPQEVSMEIKLHDFFSTLLQDAADRKNWELHVYDESAGSGYRATGKDDLLRADLRPPHDYEISFILIMNRDSLLAWQNWLKAYVENMEEKIKTQATNGNIGGFENMQQELKIKTGAYRNATMIRIKFEVNPGNTAPSSIHENLRLRSISDIPHAAVAISGHNDKTDDHGIFGLNQFTRCNDFLFLLFGHWNTTPREGNYFPLFHPDAGRMDVTTVKHVPSTEVMAIAMHIEGSPENMRKFMAQFDTGKMQSLIAKE